MTCERLTLGMFSRYQELLHTSRYEYASSLAKGKSVLDVACGTGYGCSMMSSAGAAGVLGVDSSPEAIATAEANYSREGVMFELGDAEQLSRVGDRAFDCVTSFETIEHLEDVNRYLDEVVRVLRPGGIFLVSTPERRLASTLYPIRRRPNNPFHAREYTKAEFVSKIAERFRIHECLGQTFVSYPLAFWPTQVALKGTSFALRRFGMYRLIDRLYHREDRTRVQPAAKFRFALASYWILRAERP